MSYVPYRPGMTLAAGQWTGSEPPLATERYTLETLPPLEDGAVVVLRTNGKATDEPWIVREIAKVLGKANPHLKGGFILHLRPGDTLETMNEDDMREAGWVRRGPEEA